MKTIMSSKPNHAKGNIGVTTMIGTIPIMLQDNVLPTTTLPLLVPPSLIQTSAAAGRNRLRETSRITRSTFASQATTAMSEKSATGDPESSPTCTTLSRSVTLIATEPTSETTGSRASTSSTETGLGTGSDLLGTRGARRLSRRQERSSARRTETGQTRSTARTPDCPRRTRRGCKTSGCCSSRTRSTGRTTSLRWILSCARWCGEMPHSTCRTRTGIPQTRSRLRGR
mmetsp:Transcript_39873/g.125262  ORF Transcript_39873/g.125262 Transcript_39873/m.125262 type:complete len:228 (+) Transcript_39873:721-1404(+)